MIIPINIADNKVAFTEAQLAALNTILADSPVIDRYDDDKVCEQKRIKLETVLVVKSSTYKIGESDRI